MCCIHARIHLVSGIYFHSTVNWRSSVHLPAVSSSVVCWRFIPQAGTQPFNRAMLFNVGFKEAMKDLDWDCVVFHDVDHIPENDRNYYGCGQMPRHFATKLDKYMYM